MIRIIKKTVKPYKSVKIKRKSKTEKKKKRKKKYIYENRLNKSIIEKINDYKRFFATINKFR